MVYRLFNSPIMRVIYAAAFLYVTARLLLDDITVMILLNSAVVVVMAGVVTGFVPEVWRELRSPRLTALGLLGTGTLVLCATAFLNSLWNGFYAPVRNNWVWWTAIPDNDLRLFGVLIGGVLLLTAPGVFDGRVTPRRKVYIGLAIGAAIGFIILIRWFA